ncbi:MAG: HD domain-containing protein [Deltaproteobacteria bacterium]|jgi:tRNA nucleotidyltransferase (CCA-adding enzyme)|nr:HD domain-containing protein [Deltaproteobacteria bacterium]
MKRYLVGGAVRDLLLGRLPGEWDYAFEGSAENFIQANPGARKVGRGVSVILLKGVEHMPLACGALAEDLLLRDLTVNALALDENGRLCAHPQALEDLRDRMLRLAAPDALKRDPLRLFRIARFAAQFPDFSVHPATLAAMREAAANRLTDSLSAERVGRETLKALAAPLPSRFLLLLAEAAGLHPWFAECAGMEAIPAGPPQFHRGSVLEHTCRVMDALAGDPLAVWMGLMHDLGKTTSPPQKLPHHYGHERRGKLMAHALAERLALPRRFRNAGELAAELHMQGGIYPKLRIGAKRDLLMRVHAARLDRPFWDMVSADAEEDRRADALRDLEALRHVRLPAALRGRGEESGARLRLLQCEALGSLYRARGG